MTKRISASVIAIVLMIGLNFGLLSIRQPTVTIAQQMPTDMMQVEKVADLIVYGKVTGAGLEEQRGWLVQAIEASGAVVAVAAVQPDGWFSLPGLPPTLYRLRVVDEQGTPLALAEETDAQVRPIAGEQEFQLIVKAITPTDNISPVVATAAQPLPIAPALPITPTQVVSDAASVTIEQAPLAGLSQSLPSTGQSQEITTQPRGNARIGGRVTLVTSGAPASFVTVFLLNPTVATASPLARTFTDNQGNYEFTSVNAGSYKIAVTDLRVTRFDAYLPRYYNNRENFASANVITVQDTSVLTDINLILNRAPTIVGRVTAAIGDKPLTFASVRAYTSTQATQGVQQGFTDARGYYTITALPTGNVYLQIPGFFQGDRTYLTEYHENKRTLASATPINLSINTTTTINFALDQGGKITGRVTTDLTNQPVTAADLGVYAYDAPTATRSIASVGPRATGHYTFENLLPGNYYIEFRPYVGQTLRPEFYNNKATLASADPVAVVENQTISGIDAALSQGGVISGRVTDAITGAGLDEAGISVYLATSTVATTSVRSDSTGHYTVTGLSTGSYVVQATPPFGKVDYVGEFYNNKSRRQEADSIAVVENQVQRIDIALDRGGTIKGRVTAGATGAALANVQVNAFALNNAHSASATTDATGHYTITRLPPNIYIVKFSAPSGDYIVEYYNNLYAESAANYIEVALNSVIPNIDAALETGGKISGRVTAADTGTPLANVLVTLYQRDLCNELDWMDSTRTDATGIYTYTGLLADPYVISFDDYEQGGKAYLGQYYNNKATSASADTITVALDKTTSNINAALQPGARLSGQVTAQATNQPLDDVSVSIYRQDGEVFRFVRSTTTDETGAYQSRALPAGRYRLYFVPSESGVSRPYVREWYNDKALGTTPDGIDVAVGEQQSGINAQLSLGGQISGAVTSLVTGQPLEGVDVDVYVRRDKLYFYAGTTNTDKQGRYTTVSVATGSYLLFFDTRFASDAVEEHMSLLYNNKFTFASADLINVTAGQITPNINPQLPKGGEIRGQVIAQTTGAALADIRVSASPISSEAEVGFSSTNSDKTGAYVLRGLRSTGYKVTFAGFCQAGATYETMHYNQQTTLDKANGVNVAAPNVVPNINGALPLRPGSVTLPTPTPIPPQFLKNKVYLPTVRR